MAELSGHRTPNSAVTTQLNFILDTNGDGAFNSDDDTTTSAWPKPSIATDWCQIDETTIGGYQACL